IFRIQRILDPFNPLHPLSDLRQGQRIFRIQRILDPFNPLHPLSLRVTHLATLAWRTQPRFLSLRRIAFPDAFGDLA
ncbi:MAG: hypothetical protein ACPGWR_21950, partial [Ardenticatenaceae bacterium]